MMKYLPHFTILLVALLVAPFCSRQIRAWNDYTL